MSDTMIIVLATVVPVVCTVGVGFFGVSYKIGKKDGETATEIKGLTTEVTAVKAHCCTQMDAMNGKVVKGHERMDRHLEGHPVA